MLMEKKLNRRQPEKTPKKHRFEVPRVEWGTVCHLAFIEHFVPQTRSKDSPKRMSDRHWGLIWNLRTSGDSDMQ